MCLTCVLLSALDRSHLCSPDLLYQSSSSPLVLVQFYAHVMSPQVLVHVFFFLFCLNNLLGKIENLNLGPPSSMHCCFTPVTTLYTIQSPGGTFWSCRALCSSASLLIGLFSISTWPLWSSSVSYSNVLCVILVTNWNWKTSQHNFLFPKFCCLWRWKWRKWRKLHLHFCVISTFIICYLLDLP